MRPIPIGCALLLAVSGCDAFVHVDLDVGDDTAAPGDTDAPDTDDTDEPVPVDCIGEADLDGGGTIDWREVTTFDAHGRPVALEQTDGDGRVARTETWTYDDGVITHVIVTSSVDTVEVVRPLEDGGRVVETTTESADGVITRVVRYDADGHPLVDRYDMPSGSGSDDGRVEYTWDGDVLLSRFLFEPPDSPLPYLLTAFELDAQGRVASYAVATNGDGMLEQYTYGSDGQLEQMDRYFCTVMWPLDQLETEDCMYELLHDYVYVDGRLARIEARDPRGGTLLQTTTVETDQAGRPVRVENADGITTYVYDGAGRLLERDFDATDPDDDLTVRFAYDDARKVVRHEEIDDDFGVTRLWSWDEEDRLRAFERQVNGNTTWAFTFDARGNVLTYLDLPLYDATFTWSEGCACQLPLDSRPLLGATAPHDVAPWPGCPALWDTADLRAFHPEIPGLIR